MKVALIFSGNILNQTGKFNHVFRRIENIKKNKNENDFQLDIFFIQKTYGPLFRKLKKIRVRPINQSEVKNGIRMKNLFIHQNLWEYLLTFRFHFRNLIGESQLEKYVELFENYDLLSTNDVESSFMALKVKKRYGIPFVITWHGSDINVFPHLSRGKFTLVKQLIECSDYNLFVSKYLQEMSENIGITYNKEHYYLGPSTDFYKRDAIERNKIKAYYGVKEEKIIGFVGNMVAIKNVMKLPEIFKIVNESLPMVGFVLVGEGELLGPLKNEMKKKGVQTVYFLGKRSPEDIPSIMNLMNVLVLPSINEGLGLVCMEAIRCGVHVIGSRVGGIPEVIGEENTVLLDGDFCINIANKIINILRSDRNSPSLSDEFNLEVAVGNELKVYNQVISKSRIKTNVKR